MNVQAKFSRTGCFRLAVFILLSLGVHLSVGLIGRFGEITPPVPEKPLLVALTPAAPPAAESRRATEPRRVPPAPRPVAKPVPPVAEAVADAVPTANSAAPPEAVGLAEAPDRAAEMAAETARVRATAKPANAGQLPLVKATLRYEANPFPDLPPLARQNRWEGDVQLLVRVASRGSVASVTVEKSSGYPLLDQTAVQWVSLWSFIPARRGHVPVADQVRITVPFRLEE